MEKSKLTSLNLLFSLAVVWGALIFWFAPHPPMVDIPQHAGQIALLKDMLQGISVWEDYFQINPSTPYLVAYGLTLALSVFMPIAASVKLVLSIAYISFVVLWVIIRGRVRADPRLDWLVLPAFFGVCYYWGLFSFLVAAPILLLFWYVALKFSDSRTQAEGARVFLIGLLLLLSHGLTFAFGWIIGFALLIFRVEKKKDIFTLGLPYFLLGFAALLIYIYGKEIDASIISKSVGMHFGPGPATRLVLALYFPFLFSDDVRLIYAAVPILCWILVAPFFLKLRINRHDPAAWLPFIVTCILFFILPAVADNTALIYERFSLYLLPTYAWMFTRQCDTEHSGQGPSVTQIKTTSFLLIAAVFSFLGSVSFAAWQFGKEAASVDKLIASLDQKQRMLGLIFDPSSPAAGNKHVYVHYPAWYQAEKQGLFDFNFAWYTPQLVRYRPEHRPIFGMGFDTNPENFSWQQHYASEYRYLFVRGKTISEPLLFSGAPCLPKLTAKTGEWRVFDTQYCATGIAMSSK